MSPPLITPLIKDTPSVTRGDSSPKGGAKSRLSPWESCHDVVVTERVSLKGVHKGGGDASPFGIKLYIYFPLPRRRGKIYLHGMGAGGGRGWESI